MNKGIMIINFVFIHALYAATTAGVIVALHCRELVIALLCAAARSCLKPMMEEAEWMWNHRDRVTEEEEE